MAAYYVFGIVFVLFALGLTALGLLREGFPPSIPASRAVMAGAGVIAATTFIVLVSSTHREHPREKAKKEQQAQKPPAPAKQAGGAVQVVEKEYSIGLPAGTALKAGKINFGVTNNGTIQHDLAVEGGGQEKKTPLIDAGKQAKLAVDLKPGKYKLYCTVPGHEQLGMKAEVTVK
jgi:uncharacterized cupredoxin-like copper-binding protein